MRGAEIYDGGAFQNKVNYMNASSHSYNPSTYDPVRILYKLNLFRTDINHSPTLSKTNLKTISKTQFPMITSQTR